MQMAYFMIHFRILLLLTGLLASIFCKPVIADDVNTQVRYPEFTAEYNATWTGGWFPININAQRSLRYQEDGTALLTFEADSAIAGLQEISRLTINNNIVKPLQYQYLRTGLFNEPDRNQIFDWQNKKIINGDNQTVFKDHWHDQVQDNLSYNLQASIDLNKGKTQFNYPVFDRKKSEKLHFSDGWF